VLQNQGYDIHNDGTYPIVTAPDGERYAIKDCEIKIAYDHLFVWMPLDEEDDVWFHGYEWCLL
jgi:hypothetical protein